MEYGCREGVFTAPPTDVFAYNTITRNLAAVRGQVRVLVSFAAPS